MKNACISENSAVFSLPEGEDVSPARLTQLLHRALTEAGFAPWAAAETELFSAGGETLVMARRRRRLYIGLEDLEDLLAALAHGPGGAALYSLAEGYLLALDEGSAGLWLGEFGRPMHLPPDWEGHAREQGLCLSRDAAGELLPYFDRQRPTE